MKITVTQDHINRGARCKARSCPVALAILATDKTVTYIVVCSLNAVIWQKRGWWFWKTETESVWQFPKEAARFVTAFDMGLPVKPFTFEMVKETT